MERILMLANLMLTETICHIDAYSPKNFEETLSAMPPRDKKNRLFYSLAVYDPRILVCPFQVDDVPLNKIRGHILSEAVEVLSLPASSIHLDFQVFESENNATKGVYLCCNKEFIYDYILLARRYKTDVVKITDYFLALINTLKSQEYDLKKNTVVIDLIHPSYINCGVICDEKCEFIRKIPYETISDGKEEITRSLKYASSQSKGKRYDQILLLGSEEDHKEIIDEIKAVFETDVTLINIPEPFRKYKEEDEFFHLNLVQDQTLPMEKRKALAKGLFIFIGLLIALIAFNTKIMLENYEQINQMPTTAVGDTP